MGLAFPEYKARNGEKRRRINREDPLMRARMAQFHPTSMLVTAGATIAVILAILVLLLGVLATRAS
jgi:hypothetical protein